MSRNSLRIDDALEAYLAVLLPEESAVLALSLLFIRLNIQAAILV